LIGLVRLNELDPYWGLMLIRLDIILITTTDKTAIFCTTFFIGQIITFTRQEAFT